MLIAKYNKQPNEVKQYVISYASFLAEGETISLNPFPVPSVKLLNPSSDTDPEIASPSLIVTNIDVSTDGTEISYFAFFGTDGKRYQATMTATTSNFQVVESEIEFRIVEI